jgi:hypothetical protein
LSDVRRTEARSAGIDRPDGVTRSFQVSVYKVEPSKSVFACNLFTHDSVGFTGFDKSEEIWPEVSFVLDTLTLSGTAEGLTGATSCPNVFVITYSC